MIPLKLQIKNFLSYGPTLQTIDFGTFPLICLSGKNGHGKSALLDAITWALWGQARKISGVAKADNLLLRLGQTQMLVIFDFSFNGATYRIRREYAKTFGKSYAAVDFGMIDSATQHYIPLSDKTIRDTQAQIEKTIGLDFESFVNSAFLRQGQANEFSKKSPKERKEILSSILGLNHYEKMRKLASEKVKQATLSMQLLQARKEKIHHELQKHDEIAVKIAAVNQVLTTLEQQEHMQAQHHNDLELQKQKYLKEKQEEHLLTFQCKEKITEKETREHRVRSLYGMWKKVHAQHVLISDNNHDLDKQKQLLVQKITVHQQALQQVLEAKTTLLQLQQEEQDLLKKSHEAQQQKTQEVQNTIITLQSKLNYKKSQIELLLKQKDTQTTQLHEVEKQLQAVHDELQSLHNTIDRDLIKKEQLFEKRKAYYHQWIAQANFAAKELSNVAQKKNLRFDEANPSCPLCEQNLSASRKKFLKTKFLHEEHFLEHRLNRLKKCTQHLKLVLVEQHAWLEEQKNIVNLKAQKEHLFEEYKKNKTVLENLIATTSQEFLQFQHELMNIGQECAQKNKEFCEMQTQFSTQMHELLKEVQKKIRAARTTTENTNYDQQQHALLQQQLTQLEQQEHTLAAIKQEHIVQQQRKEEILQLCKSLKQLKKEIAEVEQKLRCFNHLPALQQTLLEQEEALTATKKIIQQQKEKNLFEKGSLENERANLLQLEKEQSNLTTELKTLQQTVDDYQILTTTFSKDGIQALLIEEALPEIEQEANILLSQLTNNQSHILIESLRDLQKGGTKETLDIKISDEQGIRPYELFSGGEAFRIDFALRIAISKLLARRAGTSLQTLIIDEGFGSQDEEGLSYIMDALHKIQDNFCKIIIVSHLTSMKDQFPVHFFIEKGAQGSVVNVVEQG